MVRFDFELQSPASAEAVRTALLDFTERRPHLWRIQPAENGGSTHHIIWDRRSKTVFGKLFMD